MKNTHIFPKQSKIGRVVLLYIFSCGLIENSWIFVSASVFSVIHHIVWVEVL